MADSCLACQVAQRKPFYALFPDGSAATAATGASDEPTEQADVVPGGWSSRLDDHLRTASPERSANSRTAVPELTRPVGALLPCSHARRTMIGVNTKIRSYSINLG